MSVAVKICGINSDESLAAALDGGADLVGFVFFPRSPRYAEPALAARLAAKAANRAERVGVVVDLDDAAFAALLAAVPLDLLQLHGEETPERVAAIRTRFGVPVMKALKVATPADLGAAAAYAEVADRLMFDGKAPKTMAGALPGGNRVSFDWTMLAGQHFTRPWILSGGLDPENVAHAIRTADAAAVDVSSGVEDAPGHKDPRLIAAFLAAAKQLEPTESSWPRRKRA